MTYNNLNSETRAEQQTVELTTFRPPALSGRRNETKYEKALEFMKKKVDSDILKIADSEVSKLPK